MKKRKLLIILLLVFGILSSFLCSNKTLANEKDPEKHEGAQVVNQILK